MYRQIPTTKMRVWYVRRDYVSRVQFHFVGEPLPKTSQSGFSPFKSGKPAQPVVKVGDHITSNTRGYINENGYCPKNYSVRPKTAARKKFEKHLAEKKAIEDERAKARPASAAAQTAPVEP